MTMTISAASESTMSDYMQHVMCNAGQLDAR